MRKSSLVVAVALLALLGSAVTVVVYAEAWVQRAEPASEHRGGYKSESGSPFQSPLPTPAATPTARPPISALQARAIEYVATTNGLPEAQLVVAYEGPRDYSLSNRHLGEFKILDTRGLRLYWLLIDPADNTVFTDEAPFIVAEVEARDAKYGKLTPALFDRLQVATRDELIPIAAWIRGANARPPEALFPILAQRYPEARAAVEHRRLPFDVDDPALAVRIRQDYEQLLRADISERVEPALRFAASRSVEVNPLDMIPTVVGKLPAAAVRQLAEHPDVEVIYLIDQTPIPALSSAVQTDRIQPVWHSLGLPNVPTPNGVNRAIGIVEHGNVATTNSWLNVQQRIYGNSPEDEHATLVAGAAASYHSSLTGVAPGAPLISAGHTNEVQSLHPAVIAAIDAGARIVNVSESFDDHGRPGLEWIDRALDHVARSRQVAITVAAGNFADLVVRPPARGWNVITVGSMDDQQTAGWNDDQPGTAGSYQNPSQHVGGPHEKPEVIAASDYVTVLGPHDVPVTASDISTSIAAPQVAGLTALLHQTNPALVNYPTAAKAIIMASAAHNVEGDARLSDRDGAGAIDGALAAQAAAVRLNEDQACYGSCWWALETDPSHPAAGSHLDLQFSASPGERFRATVAWWSQVEQPPPYPNLGYDNLDTDFDLLLVAPDGGTSWWSASASNSFEIVDYVAHVAGTHHLYIARPTISAELDNTIGVALVRDATYLPMLSNNAPGLPFASDIFLWSQSPLTHTVYAFYRRPDGTLTFPQGEPIEMGPGRRYGWLPVYDGAGRVDAGQYGTATISSSQDVSAVVWNSRSHFEPLPYTSDTYSGAVFPRQEIYAPLLHRNHPNGWQSNLILSNLSGDDAWVNVDYLPAAGFAGCTTPALFVPKSGLINIDVAVDPRCNLGPGQFLGGARIHHTDPTSSVPLASVILQWKDQNGDGLQELRTSYEATSRGSATGYAPLLQRYNGNNITSLNAVDTSGLDGAALAVSYYRTGENSACGQDTLPLYANQMAFLYPSPPDGPCTDPGRPFVGTAIISDFPRATGIVVNQMRSSSSRSMSYLAPAAGARTIVIPLVLKNWDGWRGRDDWYTSLNVQNTSNESATVTVVYTNGDGSPHNSEVRTVPAHTNTIFYQAPTYTPSTAFFAGAAAIYASQPVAVVVQYFQTPVPDGADAGTAYGGVYQ